MKWHVQIASPFITNESHERAKRDVRKFRSGLKAGGRRFQLSVFTVFRGKGCSQLGKKNCKYIDCNETKAESCHH